MSMENAILEHAAALRELAAALDRNTAEMGRPVFCETPTAPAETVTIVYAEAEESKKTPVPVKDAEIEQAVQKVEEAAAKKDAPVAPAPAASAAPATSAPAAVSEAPALDYAKDVRPVLLQVIKKPGAGKPAVEKLLAEYGVTHADKLPAEHFADIIAKAQTLLAA